ncbi:MAG: GGDEF domain-containing protein [Lachnospiraceae bacterium]|nr:GGDEF domain-containing protein [Lachnospiraceae bacterium]
MKKLLYILNDCLRRFSYERVAGLYRAIQRMKEPANLYIMRTDGHTAFAPEHNRGEYNIFRLPDYAAFDGIFLDINSIYSVRANFFDEGALYAVRAAAASGKPVISIANDLDEFYYLGIDNYAAMRSVIEHLHADQKIVDFWFVMGPADNYEVQQRLQALVDYCTAHGLSCSDDRIYCESFTVACGEHGFNQLLSQHNALPQAIICANDRIALGICHAAEAAGYRIPQDFMVTGFDNDDISPYLTPSLSSVDQLGWTTGDACIDAMCRIWKGEKLPHRIFTPTKLVLRESTGYNADNHNDQRKRIAEYMSQNSIVSDFSYQLSALQYKLPGCTTIEEISLALVSCLSSIHLKGLQLILDSSLFDPGDIQPLISGYADSMEVIFTWEEGTEPDFTRRKVCGFFDSWNTNEQAHQNYLYSPLHFMDHTIGYLCIWDCIEIARIHAVSTIVNTLTVALQNFFTRKNLAHMNEVLSSLSMRDDLTGLYNRLGYHNHAYPLFRNNQGKTGILFIDMDRLKHINDSFGHEHGDKAIQAVAKAILHSIPDEAIPVRYGGDEFLVVLPVENAGDVQKLVSKIITEISKAAVNVPGAVDVPGAVVGPEAVSVSTGFVVAEPNSGKTLDDYVREADALMYEAKKRKRAQRR